MPDPRRPVSGRKRPARHVWVAIQNYAPDNPPKHPRVEHVFATEQAARAWRLETIEQERTWGAYRSIHQYEVER